jgi:hypothetical protein
LPRIISGCILIVLLLNYSSNWRLFEHNGSFKKEIDFPIQRLKNEKKQNYSCQDSYLHLNMFLTPCPFAMPSCALRHFIFHNQHNSLP